MIPLTRAQLQAEGVDGNKRAQIQQLIQRQYAAIIAAARDGKAEYFLPQPARMGLSMKDGPKSWRSNDTFITHEDIIRELTTLFPGVTITPIEQKGTAQMIYQQCGILLDWS